jgi:hypothetical protein
MVTLPSLLALLLPLPAARGPETVSQDQNLQRQRAIRQLSLSRHLLIDVGMDDYESPADDPRWVQRPDLER